MTLDMVSCILYCS